MDVRLGANEPLSKLAERLRYIGRPSAVRHLDLTNCIDVDAHKLVSLIAKCKRIISLRCAACTISASDVFTLVMLRLPHLVEVEFSCLVDRTIMDAEMTRLSGIACTQGGKALKLQRVYVEIGHEHNFRLLSTLLRYCPKANYLHVHLVCGEFHEAVRECRTLLAEHRQLDTLRFTSELPSPIQREPPTAFHFADYAAVCANLTHQRSKNFRSCARLRDLVEAGVEPQEIPFQTALVAVEDQLTTGWLREASITHDWTNVRQLCLLLLPPRLSNLCPQANVAYRECLRVLSTQLSQLVELNVSSFHFGQGLDVTAFFQDGWLPLLQSLSAPPCGFRNVLALRHLATHCVNFTELDVRFERTDSFRCCTECERGDFFVTEYRQSASPAFLQGLARLTLSHLHRTACLWFIECCRPVATLRLCYCSLELEYEHLSRALSDSSDPSCLILQNLDLRFDDATLLANLHRFAGLQYLYLLLGTRLGEGALANSMSLVLRTLPQLKCLHVHYRYFAKPSILRTVTWMRRPSGAMGADPVRGGPCFQNCSTATFIGLAKPMNRDLLPMP